MGLPISGVNRNFDDGNAYQIRIIYVAPTRRETNNSDLLSICPLNGLSLSGENGMLCIFLKRFDEINYSLILQRQIKDLYGLTDLNGRAYVGFTASTGTTYQNQLIESWKFTSIPIYRDTVGVYRPSEGRFILRDKNTNPANETSFYFGNPVPSSTPGCFTTLNPQENLNGPFWPVAGDWDGDGLDSVGLYDCSVGVFYLRNSNTTGFADITFPFGMAGDLPVAGRWLEGGVNDGIGVFRRSNGLVYLRNTLSAGNADSIFVFGNPGDLPIAGNWDGQEGAGIGIYRPSQPANPDADPPTVLNTNWSLNNALSGSNPYLVAFGNTGNLPIAGDWVTNYADGIGLYNPANGSVQLKNETGYSSGANMEYTFGAGGDRPVAGRWANQIDILAQYGIILQGNWTESHKDELVKAVQAIGTAFTAQYYQGRIAPVEAFKKVYYTANLTKIIFLRDSSNTSICQTSNNAVGDVRATVTCGANNQFTQYTAVHELGHVFTGRTGGTTSGNTYYGLIQNIGVFDTRGAPSGLVMGLGIDAQGQSDWLRGFRGWGNPAATPPALPCNFQQNAYVVRDALHPPGHPNRVTEVDEAAADSFLNWVYYLFTYQSEGYKNVSWQNINTCNATGIPDTTNLSGNARATSMGRTVMPKVATYFITPAP
jgi:hypothetical protein